MKHVLKKFYDEEAAAIQEILQGRLSEERAQMFEKLITLHCESSSEESRDSFMYGFKLGVIFMQEAFIGNSECINMENEKNRE